MTLNKNFFITLFFCFFFLPSVFAENFKKSDIKIIGNRSISKETILNYTDSKKDTLSTEDLNSLQKKLFETNFFSKIEIKISGKEVFFYLNENPLIEYLIISGLEAKPDLKKSIEKNISLKENAIFSEVLLNSDTKGIYEILSASGYFKSKVEYKVNKISNSNVNIFIDIKLNEQFFVKNIFFIGDKKLSTSTLKSAISTTESGLLDFFSSTSVPSVDRINYDISTLKKLYLSRGYYDVQVVNGSIDLIEDNYTNITFVINAGEKYIFEKFTINNKSIALTDKDLLYLNENTKSIAHDSYDPNKLNRLLKTFRDYFDSKNISVNIDYALNKLPGNKFDVVFSVVDIDEKKFINNIVTKGNELTEEKVIRANIFFAEGDLFNPSNISKSIDSLKALRFFKKVDIKTVDVKNSNNINLIIAVEEQPTGEISAGAGYGSTGSVISFNIRENNFLGQGIQSNISLQLGTEKVLTDISFFDPEFTDNGNSLSGSFFISSFTYDNAGYKNKLIGSKISTGYDIYRNVTLDSGLAFDYDSIDVQSGASSLIQSRDGNYLTTKFFYNIVNDQRNRKFQPTEGYVSGFGQSFATLASDIPYMSNAVFGSFYKELSEDFIGTIKYKIKSINSINNEEVKLSDRIFLSDSELRGFTYRGVGPKVSNEFIGGNYSYSTNFSSTIPNGLPDSWAARTNIFFDVANVWGTDFSGALDGNKIRSSTGVGLEWTSPLGPLSFTYALPITKDSTDSIENFSFKLGGTF